MDWRFTCSLFLLCSVTQALEPSKFFKLCKRNDPKFEECLKTSLHDLKPALKKGIPELKIPTIDPMSVSKIAVKQGNGPVSIDSTFTQLKLIGISNYDIKNIKADLKNYRFEFDAFLPYLNTEGDYEINGKVLVLPIAGKGDSTGNYTNVAIKAVLQGRPESRKGKTYMAIDSFKFDLDVERAIIHMNNLFNGNKQLGDTMNKFMTENWKAVYSELRPVINEAVAALITDLAVKVFNKFPLDELLPPK